MKILALPPLVGKIDKMHNDLETGLIKVHIMNKTQFKIPNNPKVP